MIKVIITQKLQKDTIASLKNPFKITIFFRIYFLTTRLLKALNAYFCGNE